ncbi:MAG: hypothetical protein AAF449_21310, partial [Myxococcota bacterium]
MIGIRRLLWIQTVLTIFVGAACTVSVDLAGKACTADELCAEGFRCVAQICVADDGTAPTDGGLVRDGGADTDAGADIDAGMMECGQSGQICCPSDRCDEGLDCLNERCSCIRKLAINEFATCALAASGTLNCVGANESGQLANGGLSRDVLQPTSALLPLPATQAFRGAFHTCALTEGGSTYCWGFNEYLQLGLMLPAGNATPTAMLLEQVPEGGFTSMSLGSFHSCALDESDRLWCWGRNDLGQCGRDDVGTKVAPPVLVNGLPSGRITEVATGAFHTCALLDGSVYCWGRNEALEVGVSGFTMTSIPRLVIDQAIRIVTGDFHTCALREDRSIWCWG